MTLKYKTTAAAACLCFSYSIYAIRSADKLAVIKSFRELKSYSIEGNSSAMDELTFNNSKEATQVVRSQLTTWGDFVRQGGDVILDGVKTSKGKGSYTFYYLLKESKMGKTYSDFSWDITFNCNSVKKNKDQKEKRFLASSEEVHCQVSDIN